MRQKERAHKAALSFSPFFEKNTYSGEDGLMGFGILFFGYFLAFAFQLSQVYFFADVLGGLVILYACSKLMQYNRYYIWTSYAVMAFILLSLVNALLMLFGVSTSELMRTVLSGVKNLAACVMHIFFLLGIHGIAMGAECQKLEKKSLRNLKLTGAYYIISYFVLFTSPLFGEAASYISIWVYIYWWICFILNLALIYQAFGLLYPADESPTERKRSRFKLINTINDKMDEFEAKSNQYRLDSIKMAQEEAERLHKEKGQKKSKKKKKK